MKAERLGHTEEQLAEHQIGLTAENDEEGKWPALPIQEGLAEFLAGYMKGKAIYPVSFFGDERTSIRHLSISIRE